MSGDELPGGWEQRPLSSVLSEPMSNGRSVPDATHGFPVLRLTALKGGRVDLSERKIGSWSEAQASRFKVREGDFLVARGNGSLALVGRGGLVDAIPDPVAYPDTLIRIRVRPDALSTDWLRLVWNSEVVRRQIESTAHTSAGIHKVNQQALASIQLPIPPLAEQKRIVAKVEELLASVNAARDRLARVPDILKRFRQSVLAAASSGALTSDWRNAHATSTAADLVETLRGKCRTEWLEPGFETRPESDLPQGWSFLALRNLGNWATGGTPSRSRRDFWDRGTVPWISPKDMKRPVLEDSQEHVTPKAVSGTRLALLPRGTVLFVVRGMILAHTFPVALTAVPTTINQDVRSLIPSSGIDPRYLLVALQREAMWILFAVKEATHGTLRLESETLHQWPIPMPPTQEQMEIVRRVETLFSLSDNIARGLFAATVRADRIAQAILAKAFRGELT